MSEIDNTPAFPHPGTFDPNTGGGLHCPESGMSLLDWFTGQALTGECANSNGYDRNALEVAESARYTAIQMMEIIQKETT